MCFLSTSKKTRDLPGHPVPPGSEALRDESVLMDSDQATGDEAMRWINGWMVPTRCSSYQML